MSGCAAVSALVILGSLIAVLCEAQEAAPLRHYPLDNMVQAPIDKPGDSPLVCYDCNSAYDPRCADPFNNYTIGTVKCAEKPVPEQLLDPTQPELKVQPQVCRKQIQRVGEEMRVIRGCGYIKDEHDDKKCFQRTSTGGVSVVYCSCTKSLCNTGHSISSPSTLVAAVTIAITHLLGRFLC